MEVSYWLIALLVGGSAVVWVRAIANHLDERRRRWTVELLREMSHRKAGNGD